MGCVSSTFLEDDDGKGAAAAGSLGRHHIVSLTSTTYGLLTTLDGPAADTSPPSPPPQPDVINSWELMAGLDATACEPSPQTLLPRCQPLSSPKSSAQKNLWSSELLKPTCAVLSSPKSSYAQNNAGEYSPELFEPRCSFSPPKSSYTQKNVRLPESLEPRCAELSPSKSSYDQKNVRSQETVEPRCAMLSSPKSSYGQKNARSPEMVEWRCGVLSPPKLYGQKKVGERKLETFERRCPPGGAECVVVYTTSLRGIRKTFEDCNAVRAVLEGTGVSVKERDVSMDMGFREELRELMRGIADAATATVPRVFVRGRYVGGAEQVLRMHEEGWLGSILEGLPRCGSAAAVPCDGCGDARFLPCFRCCGGRKVVVQVLPVAGKQRGVAVKCPDCNENGLVLCPICC